MIKIKIVGGEFKSRSIVVPSLEGVRPTQEIVRKSIFSALGEKVSGNILDVFCGTGAYGIEAISRGGEKAYFIDKQKKCLDAINKTAEIFKIKDKVITINSDYNAGIRRLSSQKIKFNYIFIDPPYNMDVNKEVLSLLEENDLLENNSIIIFEQEKKLDPIEGYKLKAYSYSYKRVGIYKKGSEQ